MPVEAPNMEDRTQPMGPLERGDQALVDAVAKLPVGHRSVLPADGGESGVQFAKYEGSGHVSVNVAAITPGVEVETAGVSINNNAHISDDGTISADVVERPVGGQGRIVTEAVGNQVQDEGDDRLAPDLHPDREAAQNIKLEIAGKIDEARRKHLGETGVAAAEHGWAQRAKKLLRRGK